MEKYSTIIDVIEDAIIEFKAHLNPKTTVPFLKEKLNDPLFCWNLKNVGWHDAIFPNGNSPGVYLLFGYKLGDEAILGVYVGKASNQSNIGSRLNSHLNNPDLGKMIYPKKDKDGNTFLIEFVATIPLDFFPFMAPALEEFLIGELQSAKIHIINSVGKY